MAESAATMLVGAAAAALALLLVGLVRAAALRAGIMDVPGARSSHSQPTPRGGGLGLLAGLAIAVAAWAVLQREPASALTPLAVVAIGVIAVAGIGWIDDWRGLSVRVRLPVHIAGALFVAFGVTAPIRSPNGVAPFVACAFCVVASINITNFMDGIDGLVGSSVAIYAGYVVFAAPPGGILRLVAVATAAACAGFLVWNRPPARIFLGDVGSGGLGALSAALGFWLVRVAHVGVVIAFLPLVPLYADAGVTLVERWLDGESLTTAHRRHLYQRLSNGGWGHTRVTLLYAALAALGACAGVWAQSWWPAAVGYIILVAGVGGALHRVAPAPSPQPHPLV